MKILLLFVTITMLACKAPKETISFNITGPKNALLPLYYKIYNPELKTAGNKGRLYFDRDYSFSNVPEKLKDMTAITNL